MSAGDFGFREYSERNDGEDVHMRNHTAYKNLRTREETEDKDEAERAHQRHVDAMSAKPKRKSRYSKTNENICCKR